MIAAHPTSQSNASVSLPLPSLRDVVFSLKAYAAALIALMIGFSQNLENPYWSAKRLGSMRAG